MNQHRLKFKLKLLLLMCLVPCLIIATKHIDIHGLLLTSIIWVKSLGFFGPIAFMIIYNLATLLFIPGSLLTLKGGCLFGVFWGSIYVLICRTSRSKLGIFKWTLSITGLGLSKNGKKSQI